MQNNQNSSSGRGAENVRFADLGLSEPLLKAVAGQGYEIPTPIQAKAIPAVLSGRDVMAAAQTGTGKTAGFTLPILHRLSASGERERSDGRNRGRGSNRRDIRALIVTPTRELAAQVEESVRTYGGHLPIRTAVVFGGVKINPQIEKLRRGVDILVATPGRLLDLHGQGAVEFSRLETLVLDEADRMLDMGFIHDIRRILRILPEKRQNLMFSATFSDEIQDLGRGMIHDPVEISVSPRNSTVESVRQMVVPADKTRKADLLIHLIKDENWYQALVFSRTKHGANRLAQKLEKKGIQAAAIHGNKSQNARTRALGDFKSGKLRILVATDIAARGLDIDQLPHVVNFDLPNVSEDYVHRIGRTGRAGAEGTALSLVCAEEAKLLRGIEKLIGKSVERRIVPGFEPLEALPETHAPNRGSSRGDRRGPRPGGPRRASGPQGSGGRNRNSGGGNRGNGHSSARGGGYGNSQGRRHGGGSGGSASRRSGR
jgi:ATP-dependent RNA helicase RhlE